MIRLVFLAWIVLLPTLVSAQIQPALQPTTQPTSQPVARDLAEYREKYPSKLIMHGPTPPLWQSDELLILPRHVREVTYPSGGLQLKAWLSDAPTDGKPHPAVVFCHGGFWFGNEDWDAISPLLDAGFIVMMPRVRGENEGPGEFGYYLNEVDDVNAAGRFLAAQSGVDKSRLFVAGHSAGGDLAALAVMESTPFVLSAPIGASLDIRNASKWTSEKSRQLLVFDPADLHEVEQRSAVLFTSGLRAPIHLIQGKKDGTSYSEKQLLTLAHRFAHSASLTFVEGNHFESLNNAMPELIKIFNDFSPTRHIAVDWPDGWKLATQLPHTAIQIPGINIIDRAFCFVLSERKDRLPLGEDLAKYSEATRKQADALLAPMHGRTLPSVDQTIAAQKVTTFDATSTVKTMDIRYRRYLFETPHYIICITAWSRQSDFDAAVPTMEALVGSVHESE